MNYSLTSVLNNNIFIELRLPSISALKITKKVPLKELENYDSTKNHQKIKSVPTMQ